MHADGCCRHRRPVQQQNPGAHASSAAGTDERSDQADCGAPVLHGRRGRAGHCTTTSCAACARSLACRPVKDVRACVRGKACEMKRSRRYRPHVWSCRRGGRTRRQPPGLGFGRPARAARTPRQAARPTTADYQRKNGRVAALLRWHGKALAPPWLRWQGATRRDATPGDAAAELLKGQRDPLRRTSHQAAGAPRLATRCAGGRQCDAVSLCLRALWARRPEQWRRLETPRVAL